MFRHPITQDEARRVLEALADSEITLSEPTLRRVLIGEYFENPNSIDALAILSVKQNFKNYIIAPLGDDKLEYDFSRDEVRRFKVDSMDCFGEERAIMLSSPDDIFCINLHRTSSTIPMELHFEEVDYDVYLGKYLATP